MVANRETKKGVKMKKIKVYNKGKSEEWRRKEMLKKIKKIKYKRKTYLIYLLIFLQQFQSLNVFSGWYLATSGQAVRKMTVLTEILS